MKQALYLGSQQRRLGTRKDVRMPLYELSSYWKPNKEMSRWRLDVFRPWRDRTLEYLPPKTVKICPINDGFATLNVNGLIGKQPDFIDFLHLQRLGFVAIQSHMTSAKVLRNWSISSDHYPLTTKLRVTPPPLVKPSRVPRYRFNLDAVKGHGGRLVNSNRWNLLEEDEIEDEESLDEGALAFDHAVNREIRNTGKGNSKRGERSRLTG
jgi:hypothetical protein